MKPDGRPDWTGLTVVCIASGPSLTPEDCDLVKASGPPVIVTNTSFRLAPWADVVFGFDSKWWVEYHEEVKRTCSGRLMSVSNVVARFGVESLYGCPWFSNFQNSGVCAISLAIAGHAKTVVLLGYDCQKTAGKTHWHGDHPNGLGNAISMKEWPRKFAQVAKHASRNECRVLNCSRSSALTCFERMDLEQALCIRFEGAVA